MVALGGSFGREAAPREIAAMWGGWVGDAARAGGTGGPGARSQGKPPGMWRFDGRLMGKPQEMNSNISIH